MVKVLIIFQKESSGLHMERCKYPHVGSNERRGKPFRVTRVTRVGEGHGFHPNEEDLHKNTRRERSDKGRMLERM